jgi:hypothetical protein
MADALEERVEAWVRTDLGLPDRVASEKHDSAQAAIDRLVEVVERLVQLTEALMDVVRPRRAYTYPRAAAAANRCPAFAGMLSNRARAPSPSPIENRVQPRVSVAALKFGSSDRTPSRTSCASSICPANNSPSPRD